MLTSAHVFWISNYFQNLRQLYVCVCFVRSFVRLSIWLEVELVLSSWEFAVVVCVKPPKSFKSAHLFI